VPALTFGVSTNFALANFLASRSFGNVLVALTRFRFPRGSSNETYHVPLDLLAMIPSRGLRRRLTDRGRELNRRLTKSFRLPPASPHDSFSAVAGAQGSLPSQNAPASFLESRRGIVPVGLAASNDSESWRTFLIEHFDHQIPGCLNIQCRSLISRGGRH
jgi:hypothetical protein